MKVNILGDIVPNDDKWVYDWLGLDSTCPKDLHEAAEKAGGEALDVWINSGGGDLFAGSEMYETLRSYPGTVRVHIVLAASAATLPACAGRSEIAPTGMYMIHNVGTGARGDYHAMDKASEVLKKANEAVASAYTAKTGRPIKELLQLMDRETWLTGQEAVDAGFVDAVSQETRRLAAAGPGTLPAEVVERIKATVENPFQARSVRAAQASLELLNMKGAVR